METNCDTSVKVAVRIRPLSTGEIADDSSQCITTVPGEPQVLCILFFLGSVAFDSILLLCDFRFELVLHFTHMITYSMLTPPKLI